MAKCVSMTIFAKNVNAARESQNLTIQELADLVGIERSYLSRVLHGHNSPSLRLMEKIATACGEPLFELLTPKPERILSKTA